MDPVSMLVPVAESIIASAAKRLAGSATQGVRARIFGDPEQKALARALARAFATVEKRHGRRLADFDVNAGFWKHEGAEELAKVLVPGTAASAAGLARRAVDSLGPQASEDDRLDRIVLLRPVFTTLLDELSVEVRGEPVLQVVLGRTDAADTARAATQLATHAGAGVAGEDDLIAYLRWLADQHRYLPNVGVVRKTRVQLPLAEVFVGLRARPEKHPGDRARLWFEQERDKLAAMVESGRLDATGFEAALDRLHLQAGRRFDVADESDRAQPAPVLDAVRNHAQSLVLGDPGSGKTTLLKHLALTHALALASGKPVQGKPARFPIYLRIGDYARQGYPEQGIGEFLPGYLNRLECRTPGLADLLRRELDAGRCLVLLDGLDEIASAELRRGVVEAVTRFVTAHSRQGNRFVVTSRIAGYQAAPLPEPFVAVRLQDMDQETIDRFLEVYCREVERAETPDKSDPAIVQAGQQEAAAIREALATNHGVRRLAANPLLLTALVLVHRASGRLPHRRVEAYVEVCNALGRTWRTAQGVAAADLPDERMLTRWLTELGFWMHEHRPEGAASQVELLTVLGPLWAAHHGVEWDPTVVEAADPLSTNAGVGVIEFVEEADRHTGLLIERAPGRYGFPHLTFEEYYAGRALAFRGTAEQRIAAIRSRLHDPRYDEPILLALGLIGTDYTEQIETVVAEAIWPATAAPSRYEDLLGRDFLFMLRVLADDTPLQTATIDAVLHCAIAEWLTPETSRCRFRSYREVLFERLRSLAGTKAGDRFRAILDQQAAALAETEPTAFTGLAAVAVALGPLTPHIDTALTTLVVGAGVDQLNRARAVAVLAAGGSLAPAVSGFAVDIAVDSLVRMEALEALAASVAGESLSPSLVEVLVEFVQDDCSDLWVRLAALRVLTVVGSLPMPVVEVALKFLLDTELEPTVAVEALAAGSPLSPVVVEALVGVVLDADVELWVRSRAALVVAAGGVLRPSAVERLVEFVVDDNAKLPVRGSALTALAASGPFLPSGVEVLMGFVLDAEVDLWVRRQTACVLVAGGPLPPVVAEALVGFVLNAGVGLLDRVAAVRALTVGGPLSPVVVEALVEFVVDDGVDLAVRVLAVRALAVGGFLSPVVVEVAMRLALDGEVDAAVRVETVRALAVGGSLPPVAAEVAVGIAVDDGIIWWVRKHAVEALRRASPTEAIIARLVSLFTVKNQSFGADVGRTLVAIARQHPASTEAIAVALAAVCSHSTGDGHDGEGLPGVDEAHSALRSLVSESVLAMS
ncbi:NACHT domain-containing protein [Solwaraspora sp. WMMD792]|uniref:NACHT domain-containing protein n=1 Tax=Solwaraspora sp. WMMD792 TaxID=3016099 RepID=UPI0024169C05|nr:NACHT domain-containing protein [Solwaraspora sp. WMMD792]MDG4773796.1 NACHT domain-containing protein [Solwaraspora sp. WMMD792]